MMHCVYMIKNAYDKLYIGITEDLNKRLYFHNARQGALFTKTESKFKIVFYEEYRTLAEAHQREVQIKKWRREKKEILVERYNKNLPTKQSMR